LPRHDGTVCRGKASAGVKIVGGCVIIYIQYSINIMQLRSKEMRDKYAENQSHYTDFSSTKNFEEDKERVIQSFNHWNIITNLFPYDNVAEVHDMLVPKRIFGGLFDCTTEEWDEYKSIINQLEEDSYYDVLIKNFSKHKSIHRHLHIHLIIWKK